MSGEIDMPAGSGSVGYYVAGGSGRLEPQGLHCIAALFGSASYSVWLRWPKSAEMELRGVGWKAQSARAPIYDGYCPNCLRVMGKRAAVGVQEKRNG